MSETKVTCKGCGVQVPKAKFCGECGAKLSIVDQPTRTQDDNVSTPIQVANSDTCTGANELASGQSTDVANESPTPPSTTHDRHTDIRNKETNNTPSSYAQAARSNLLNEDRTSGQQSNQGSLSDNRPASSSEKLNVTVSKNDGTAANFNGGASKADGKVLKHEITVRYPSTFDAVS